MLAVCGIRAVGGDHNQDRAVHLRAPVIMFFT